MKYFDFHVHSSFSGDCKYDMESMICNAISKSIKKICFTDHYDFDYPYTTDISFEVNLIAYFETIKILKEKYRDKIDILFGIEFGLQPHIFKDLNFTTNQYPFDFIIASTHVIGKADPYYGDYYKGKTQKEAYHRYFEDILYNVNHYDNYDVYGHLDYIIRYGKYETKAILYQDHSDIIDEVLKRIIETGHGIELNTSGFRYNLKQPHPNSGIIRRYKELGGEIITLGSDAHKPEDIASEFNLGYDILKSCGFNYITVFANRKPEFIKID